MTRRASLEVLQRARARITDPDRWAFRTVAVDSRNRNVDPRDPKAVAWCAIGAISAEVSPRSLGAAEIAALAVAARELWPELRGFDDWDAVTEVNDSYALGHEAVLKMYDRAIERRMRR